MPLESEQLRDAETIAEWMAGGNPNTHSHDDHAWWKPELHLKWWVPYGGGTNYAPQILTLDRLWLVEDRLTEAQMREYEARLWAATGQSMMTWSVIHATWQQKLTALARVIRETKESNR